MRGGLSALCVARKFLFRPGPARLSLRGTRLCSCTYISRSRRGFSARRPAVRYGAEQGLRTRARPAQRGPLTRHRLVLSSLRADAAAGRHCGRLISAPTTFDIDSSQSPRPFEESLLA